MKEISLREFGLTTKEEIFLLTSVGNKKTGRSERDFNPVEVGEKINTAIVNGATHKIIADFLSVDQALIGRFLRVFKDFNSKYHHLVSFNPIPHGHISFDNAQEIARFSKSEQSQLVKAILEYKFKREQIQAVFQQLERSDKKLSQIIKDISKRTGGQRRTLFMDAIPEDLSHKIKDKKLLELDKICQKIMKKNSVIKILQKDELKIEKFKIGKNTFTILFLRASVPKKTTEKLSEVILKEISNEIK